MKKFTFQVRSIRKNAKNFVVEVSAVSYEMAMNKILSLYPGKKIREIDTCNLDPCKCGHCEKLINVDKPKSGLVVILTKGLYKGCEAIVQYGEGVKFWVEIIGEGHNTRVLTSIK